MLNKEIFAFSIPLLSTLLKQPPTTSNLILSCRLTSFLQPLHFTSLHFPINLYLYLSQATQNKRRDIIFKMKLRLLVSLLAALGLFGLAFSSPANLQSRQSSSVIACSRKSSSSLSSHNWTRDPGFFIIFANHDPSLQKMSTARLLPSTTKSVKLPRKLNPPLADGIHHLFELAYAFPVRALHLTRITLPSYTRVFSVLRLPAARTTLHIGCKHNKSIIATLKRSLWVNLLQKVLCGPATLTSLWKFLKQYLCQPRKARSLLEHNLRVALIQK